MLRFHAFPAVKGEAEKAATEEEDRAGFGDWSGSNLTYVTDPPYVEVASTKDVKFCKGYNCIAKFGQVLIQEMGRLERI